MTKSNKEVITMPKAQTSSKVASKASSIMRDGRTSSKSKSVAASALRQARKTSSKQTKGN